MTEIRVAIRPEPIRVGDFSADGHWMVDIAVQAQPSMESPKSIEELGLRASTVVDLFVKRASLEGVTSLGALASSLGIHPRILEGVFLEMRENKMVDIKTMVGTDYQFALTDLGKTRAAEAMDRNRYSGIAPVALATYEAMVWSQVPNGVIDREKVHNAFGDLVVAPGLLDQIGPSVISRRGLFLHGPAGTGKTSIAERLGRLYEDAVWVPHAVEADGQIISVFDPIAHVPVEPQPAGFDPRWMWCHRPIVQVGGEMELAQLDLAFDARSGIYAPSLQLQANNGILVIDDFGRQSAQPDDIMNRWIVPLSRRIDYLSMVHGFTFTVPFDVLIVLSTNFKPEDLGEAAARRIQAKVYIGAVTDEQFDWILARIVNAKGMGVESGMPAYLRSQCRELGHGDLRANQPSDICAMVESIAAYEGVAPALEKSMVDRALALFFATEGWSDAASTHRQ